LLVTSCVHRAEAFASEGFVQQKKIEWETVTGLLQMPNDTGTVAVIDGGM
jgi:hypothetical protein